MMKRSSIWGSGLILALCAIFCPHCATASEEIVISVEPRNVGPGEEWKYDAAILEEMGFATDTETLVRLVEEDPDLVVRGLAASVLGRRGEVETIESLKKALDIEPTERVRGRIAVALIRLGEPLGLEVLRQLLRSARKGSDRVRWARRLAEFGDFSGFPAVSEAARSDREYERFAAARAVSRFVSSEGGTRSTELLLALSGDPSVRVRREAIRQFSSAVARGASPEPFLEAANRIAEEDEAEELREAAKSEIRSIRRVLRDAERGG